MDDYLTKRARRYWASWKRHYGMDSESVDNVLDDKKMVEAIRRALGQAHKEGQRVGQRIEKEDVK